MNNPLKRAFVVFCSLSLIIFQNSQVFATSIYQPATAAPHVFALSDQALTCEMTFAARTLLKKAPFRMRSSAMRGQIGSNSRDFRRDNFSAASKSFLTFFKLPAAFPSLFFLLILLDGALVAQDVPRSSDVSAESPSSRSNPNDLSTGTPPRTDAANANSRFILDAKALSASPKPTETILNLIVWAKQYEVARNAADTSPFRDRIAGSGTLATIDNLNMSATDADVVSRLFAKLYFSRRGVEELLYVLKTDFGLTSDEIKDAVKARVDLEHKREEAARIPEGKRFSLSGLWESLKPIHHPDAFDDMNTNKTSMTPAPKLGNRKKSFTSPGKKLIGSAA